MTVAANWISLASPSRRSHRRKRRRRQPRLVGFSPATSGMGRPRGAKERLQGGSGVRRRRRSSYRLHPGQSLEERQQSRTRPGKRGAAPPIATWRRERREPMLPGRECHQAPALQPPSRRAARAARRLRTPPSRAPPCQCGRCRAKPRRAPAAGAVAAVPRAGRPRKPPPQPGPSPQRPDVRRPEQYRASPRRPRACHDAEPCRRSRAPHQQQSPTA